jgi:IS30 family transposase
VLLMTKNYSHLSQEQRYQLEALLKVGQKKSIIAQMLGVHRSTIYREIKRCLTTRGPGAFEYRASKADRHAQLLHKYKPKKIRFTEALKEKTRIWLREEKLSPELISIKGHQELGDFVSHETIYQWIWKVKHSFKIGDQKDKKLYKELKHGKRRRKRANIHGSRGLIPNRVSIEQRPAIVNKRKRIGDTEVDLMMGKHHRGALLVVIDRATLKTSLQKVATRDAPLIARKIIRKFISHKRWMKTMTFDNDLAFAAHEQIAKRIGVKTFFARPYTSQDKGSVENRIGIIRRFFPKKTDLSLVSDYEVKRVERILNKRPVRKFNYKTPNQVYKEKLYCRT